ncbi:MAG: hypothetical protein U0Y68_23910 [Blastocatellia bacterium]
MLDTDTLYEVEDDNAASYKALVRFIAADRAYQDISGDVLAAARKATQQELSQASFEAVRNELAEQWDAQPRAAMQAGSACQTSRLVRTKTS